MTDSSKESNDRGVPVVVKAAVGAALGAGTAALGIVASPAAIILGGALAPVVMESTSALLERRARRFRSNLEETGLDLERLEGSPEVLLDGQVDLIRESIQGALGTDFEPKSKMLSWLLNEGLSSKVELEVGFMRRLSRTVVRLDEIDFRTVLALDRASQDAGPMVLKDIESESGVGNPDLVRSALAILVGEGLVRFDQGSKVDRWQLTDYGLRLLGIVRAAFSSVDGA